MRPIEHSETRYLFSKRSVDDRALNRVVLDALRRLLRAQHEAPRVLELGAGTGTMVSRLLDWNILERAHVTLVDTDTAALEAARSHLQSRQVTVLDGPADRDGARRASLTASLAASDAFDFVEALSMPCDLVVANAFLDLIDVPAFLRLLWQRVPGALAWFTINFDGETILLPELELDAAVMALYHRSMDVRVRNGRPAGDSRTGRHLLQRIPESGGRIVQAGSSDWVVWPAGGEYPQDEAYFLHHIVRTIDLELTGHPELDRAAFAEWVETRHGQIEAAQLTYVAHQLDVLAAGPSCGHQLTAVGP